MLSALLVCVCVSPAYGSPSLESRVRTLELTVFTKADAAAMRAEMKADAAAMRAETKADMARMESRTDVFFVISLVMPVATLVRLGFVDKRDAKKEVRAEARALAQADAEAKRAKRNLRSDLLSFFSYFTKWGRVSICAIIIIHHSSFECAFYLPMLLIIVRLFPILCFTIYV